MTSRVAAAHNNDLFALAQLSFKKGGAVMDPVPTKRSNLGFSCSSLGLKCSEVAVESRKIIENKGQPIKLLSAA